MKKEQLLKEAFYAATNRIVALENMLLIYRIRKSPPESLLDKLEVTRTKWLAAAAALAAEKGQP